MDPRTTKRLQNWIDKNDHLHFYPKSCQVTSVKSRSSSHFHAFLNCCDYVTLQTAMCFVHTLEYAGFSPLKLPLLTILVALRPIPLLLPPTTLRCGEGGMAQACLGIWFCKKPPALGSSNRRDGQCQGF